MGGVSAAIVKEAINYVQPDDYQWVHRCCETCWSRKVGVYNGRICVPTQYPPTDPEPCCWCGNLAFLTSIYAIEDPAQVMCKGDHETWGWSHCQTLELPARNAKYIRLRKK